MRHHRAAIHLINVGLPAHVFALLASFLGGAPAGSANSHVFCSSCAQSGSGASSGSLTGMRRPNTCRRMLQRKKEGAGRSQIAQHDCARLSGQ
jgi:hypothetical protein